jgi:class 3 adenylate cyclase
MTNIAPPDVAPQVVVLMADMVGSSQLYAEQGNSGAFRIVSRCLGLLEHAVQVCGGRVVKRMGDGIFAIFQEATAAVNAAAQIHQAIEATDWGPDNEPVHVRVGISQGMAVLDDDDVYGDVVNVAARLASLAGGDEVLVSELVHNALLKEMQTVSQLLSEVVLRGRPTPERVYRYMWQPNDSTVNVPAPARSFAAALEVIFDAQSLLLHAGRPRLRIGRAPDNDIMLDLTVVTRHHADLMLRGSAFYVSDHSTNGTMVYLDGGQSIRVHRNEVTLSGSGHIVVGSDVAPPIQFREIVLRPEDIR